MIFNVQENIEVRYRTVHYCQQALCSGCVIVLCNRVSDHIFVRPYPHTYVRSIFFSLVYGVKKEENSII